jgi:hypothetical protein
MYVVKGKPLGMNLKKSAGMNTLFKTTIVTRVIVTTLETTVSYCSIHLNNESSPELIVHTHRTW